MRRVGAQIRKLARGLGFEGSLTLSRIRARWDELIGPPVSLHSWPVFLERGTLTLAVESPAWLQQMSFYSEQIKGKLTEFSINAVKLRVGRVPERDKPGNNDNAPDTATALSDDAREFIQEEASNISTPELKDHIVRAMESWAAKRRNKTRPHR